ncbi:Integrin beta-like protein 1 [Galemys pyrenaicus]|uniref:Integrin beta-like protein 1 n=1 Tax=Galemys pyrenaicus TaxID=202257 RepID=A0A8J6A9K9_GALPY|nr:Integrin beta-like protein 1 [Galemys pyrenaicus]
MALPKTSPSTTAFTHQPLHANLCHFWTFAAFAFTLENQRLGQEYLHSLELTLEIRVSQNACPFGRPTDSVTDAPAFSTYFAGKCECGRCTCYPPGDRRVYGRTCECDDRRCEDLEGVVCGGLCIAPLLICEVMIAMVSLDTEDSCVQSLSAALQETVTCDGHIALIGKDDELPINPEKPPPLSPVDPVLCMDCVICREDNPGTTALHGLLQRPCRTRKAWCRLSHTRSERQVSVSQCFTQAKKHAPPWAHKGH